MKLLVALIIALGSFFSPSLVLASGVLRGPLSYSLQDYGFVLAISLAGGFISWVNRVRKGKVEMSLSALVGELAASAFAGLITYWVCEATGVHPLITAACTGMAGHMGSGLLVWIESKGKKLVGDRFGVGGDTGNAPLDDK